MRSIIAVALLVRLLVSLLYQHVTLYPDSNGYVALATRLMNFNLAGYEGERAPGYPLLLCLSGLCDPITVVFQSLTGIFTLILIYKILLLTGVGKKLSLGVILILACYLPAVFFELAILTETLTLFVMVLIFYVFLKMIVNQKYTFYSFLQVAVLCAFLILVKPFYVFLPFLLVVMLLLRRGHIDKAIGKYLLLMLIPLSAFWGWSYVNKVNTGYFVPSTYYGFNLAQNCVSFAENTTPEYVEIGRIYAKHRDHRISDKELAMALWEAYPELKAKTRLPFPALSEQLYEYSIATIKKNPEAYLKQVFISWRDFWKTSLYWEPYSFEVPEASGVVLYICYAERILLQLMKILFVLLIPLNLFMAFRKKDINPSFIISVTVFTASLLQALMTYGTNSRFSFPFEMLMVVSVVLNMVEYGKYYRNKREVM